jgi:hypothetical protein
MKVISVVLIGLMGLAYASAQGAPKASPAEDQARAQIREAIQKLFLDYSNMRKSGTIDDKNLIEQSKNILNLMKSNVDKAPEAIRPMINSFISAIENNVAQMEKTGKFEPTAFSAFFPPGTNPQQAVKNFATGLKG